MAKTLSPLFSSSAHGKLARSLIYSKKKTGQLARAMHYPKKEPSLKQWTRRHIVGLLTAHWQCMTDDERSAWNTNAASTGLNLPGYQYFLKSAQADLYTHHGLVCYFAFNEATGEDCICSVCNMIMGKLEPSYPDDCPNRLPSFKKEYGNCLSFNGTSDRVKVAHHPRFNITNQFSIEIWFKPAVLAGGARSIFSNWVGLPDRRCWALVTFFNMFLFQYSPDGTTSLNLTADTKISTEWTHLVIRLQPDNTLNIFLNSVKDTSDGELVSLHTYVQDLFVGSLFDGSYFNGLCDEARIYNRALSDEEIKKHYQLLRLNKIRQPLLRL